MISKMQGGGNEKCRWGSDTIPLAFSIPKHQLAIRQHPKGEECEIIEICRHSSSFGCSKIAK
jgi:hypothetical protein